MCRALVVLLCAIGAVLPSDRAFADEAVLTVSRPYRVDAGGTTVVEVYCPPGYVLFSFSITADGPARDEYSAIDANGVPVDWNVPGQPSSATGFRFGIQGDTQRGYSGIASVYCTRATPDMTIVVSQATIPANGNGSVAGFCPAPLIPVGLIGNVDGVELQPRFSVYIFGTSPNFVLMDDLPDGIAATPTGIGLGVTNTTGAPKIAHALTRCVPLVNAHTIISSAPTTPGGQFFLAGGVPDSVDVVSFKVVGGLYGTLNALEIWGKDGTVTSQLPFQNPSGTPSTTAIREILVVGTDTRQSFAKASARAVLGVLVIPAATAPPPPTVVSVVEFHNAALDHYFITAIPKEISDLDAGVHPGWQRSGEAFNAYAIGSTGRTGRRPVCRAYGNPAAHLDSHFYSASPAECYATLSGFNGAWLLEASEVFQMDLPDAVTGACPAGGMPIYRVWNNRVDSNHRYTTTIARRDQMVARGYIAEGYGPQAVTLCALP